MRHNEGSEPQPLSPSPVVTHTHGWQCKHVHTYICINQTGFESTHNLDYSRLYCMNINLPVSLKELIGQCGFFVVVISIGTNIITMGNFLIGYLRS